LLQLHHSARTWWGKWWNARLTTASAINKEIFAIKRKLTGPREIRPGEPPVMLDGLEDFRRLVNAEVLRARLVGAQIDEMEQRYDSLEHRLGVIDRLKDDLQRQIDRRQRDAELLRDELVDSQQGADETGTLHTEPAQWDTSQATSGRGTEPDPPPAKPPRVIRQVVDAKPSGVLGTSNQRRCVWRFYIELEETNGTPVELLFKEATYKPRTQDPHGPQRHGPPPVRFTLAPGQKLHLGGVLYVSTGMWRLTPSGMMGGSEEMQDIELPRELRDGWEKQPSKRKIGPYYLTVWEKDNFAGEFLAVFESVRPVAGDVIEVPFTPGLPPWATSTPGIPMKVRRPSPQEAAGSFGRRPYEPYFEVDVQAPQLPPGMYRMKVTGGGVADQFLWGRLRQGDTTLRLAGNVPMLPGRRKVTLSLPELPQVKPEELNLNVIVPSSAPSPQSVRNSQKQIQRLKSEPTPDKPDRLRYHQQRLANAYSNLAFKHIQRAEFARAKGYIAEAMGYLQAAGAANELTTGGYGGDVNRGTLLGHMATIAYFEGSDGQVRQNLTALADYYEASAAQCASKGDTRGASNLRSKAADCHWKIADQLLALGAYQPEDAVRAWDDGYAYYRKAGGRSDPKKPAWWPR
jgi:hypothetical protein